MAAHNEGGESARMDERLNIKMLLATIFFSVLAVGSMYGCVVDDGYRGEGRRGGDMSHRDEGPRDRVERDDHRDQRVERRDREDRREQH